MRIEALLHISKTVFFFAALSLLAACGQNGDEATGTSQPEASAQSLPDWSGWWEALGGPDATSLREALADRSIYQPEARQIVEEAAMPGANLGGGAVHCVPIRFNGGSNGGGTDDVEFLLMPERLTITNGRGLLRRIPIDGRPLRENPEPSRGGTSIGIWEGDTLVVETIGLHPDTAFPIASHPNSPHIGDNAHVIERFHLNSEDQLVVSTVLTAPELLTAPLEFSVVYRRDPGYVYRDNDFCSLNDRSIDPDTGLQRFDLTPPADLPPPPPAG